MQGQKTPFRWLWIPPVFMILGLILASWYLPDFLEWYANPFLSDAVSCAPTIRWTIRKMLWLQVAASILGFVLGCWIVYRIYVKNQKSTKPV